MSEYLKEISYTQLKELLRTTKLSDLKGKRSFEVVGDGKYAFTVAIPTTDFCRGTVERACVLSNSVCSGGEVNDKKEETNGNTRT